MWNLIHFIFDVRIFQQAQAMFNCLQKHDMIDMNMQKKKPAIQNIQQSIFLADTDSEEMDKLWYVYSKS